MGRLVYISVPNYLNDNLIGTEIPKSAFFQGVVNEVRELLMSNGVDVYIASSTIRDEADRYAESIEMRSDLFLQIDIIGGCPAVYCGGGYAWADEAAIIIAKRLSKINRKYKYKKSYTNDINCGDLSEVPLVSIDFKYRTSNDSEYLLTNSDEISERISQALCAYFGIKWNYRPCNIDDQEYRVYMPPFNNIIKARTIASQLKKNNNINAKVL